MIPGVKSNKAGIQLTEEGSIALSMGIGGQGKTRFETGKTGEGDVVIRLCKAIEDSRAGRRKWKDMIFRGKKELRRIRRTENIEEKVQNSSQHE